MYNRDEASILLQQMMPRFKHVREGDLIFVFKYDEDDPSILHIYARHLTTVQQAIDTWFDEDAEETWNPRRERFETRSQTHEIYWFWLEEDRRVLIITCFQREADES